ncbi:alpha/beta hydrolase [Aureimonas populi]|uniref:Acyl-CoA:diacylglycerol acyltransferase n=1 Tax=Aureimonas populi TaxID=1701758 RepID=A0ABW5CPY7_9HYPH|nr:alpha/beta hydrolase-fold protein [Aureimonas populi]
MTEPLTRRHALALGLGLAASLPLAPASAQTITRDLKPAGAPHDYRLFIERMGGEGPLAALYLLDGNRTFPLAREAALRADRPLLLVGLGYPVVDGEEIIRRRFLDFTPPTPPEAVPAPPGGPARETGGRDFFAGVLAASVGIAERDHEVAAGRRTLFGHSLGGHFALHMVFAHSPLFARILSADPSVWWNDYGLMRELEAFRKAGGSEMARRLSIVTAGERPAPTGRPLLDVRRSGPGGAEMAGALRDDPALKVGHEVYAGETHGSMIPRSVEAAVALALT